MTQDVQAKRIDILDTEARARWAAAFGISEDALKQAVRRFGTVPATVRAALGLPTA